MKSTAFATESDYVSVKCVRKNERGGISVAECDQRGAKEEGGWCEKGESARQCQLGRQARRSEGASGGQAVAETESCQAGNTAETAVISVNLQPKTEPDGLEKGLLRQTSNFLHLF